MTEVEKREALALSKNGLHYFKSKDDTVATIGGSNYFDKLWAELNVGELIIARDNTNEVNLLVVTKSDRTGVTVAKCTVS